MQSNSEELTLPSITALSVAATFMSIKDTNTRYNAIIVDENHQYKGVK
jgi:hypothetical protein